MIEISTTIMIGDEEFDVIVEGSYIEGQREIIHPADRAQEGIPARCEVETITEDTMNKNPRTWEVSDLSKEVLWDCANFLLEAHDEGGEEPDEEADYSDRADMDDRDHGPYGRDIYD